MPWEPVEIPHESDSTGRLRMVMAFLFLIVSVAVVSYGAWTVVHLGKLQEGIASREALAELREITDPDQIDDALRRHPSNKFLQLMATATKTAHETRAAFDKLSTEIEPAALAKEINPATASRGDLEALRDRLKTAEANASTFLPRYAALLKAERDKMENYARSLHLESDTVRGYLEGVDKRHARIMALTAQMLSGRADYFRGYENYVAILIGETGSYKIVNGQFIFPFQTTADRFNAAVGSMTAATKRVAELEEQKPAAQSQQAEWEKFINGK